MKLKSTLILVVFLCISSFAVGQDNKKAIELQFTEYLNTLIKKDFNKAVNYISDDFFEIIPKKQMVLLMEKTFNNPEMEFEIREPRILEIGDSEQIDGKHYALMRYSNLLSMKFTDEEAADKTEDEAKLRMSLLKLTLEKTFGSGNVKLDEATDWFEIYSEKKVYAISNDGVADWKFIVVEKDQKFILEKLLPQKIINSL